MWTRIRILLHIEMIQICNNWSTDTSWLYFVPLKLLNVDLKIRIRIHLCTQIRIRIKLPKIILINASYSQLWKKDIIFWNQWWGFWTFLRFWRSSQAGTTFFELLKHVHVKVSILSYPVFRIRIRVFSSWIPDSGSAPKKFKYLNPKICF